MKNLIKGPYQGFMSMIFTFLGIVLWLTLFGTIMTQFDVLMDYAHLSSFTLLETVYKIAPVVLFLGVLGALGFGYVKSAMSVSKQGDINGLMEIVFGALQIILFITLFSTIVDSLYTVLSLASIADYIALSTVVQISAVIIFLGGIFASIANIVGGTKRILGKRKATA